MRVLWVSHSSQVGGAELTLAEGLRPLAELGHAVDVVLPRDGPLLQHLEHAADVHIAWHNRWAGRPPLGAVRHRLRQAAFNVLVASREIASIAQTTRADLIVTNTIVDPTGALAAMWSGKPHVWFLHEYGQEDHGLAFHLGRRTSFGLMKRSADLFLVNSCALRSHFAACLPGAALRRVHLAVDVPVTDAGQPGPPGSPLRLVLVGRRRPSKGQQDAVAAVGRLASKGVDVELELVGSGDPRFDEELRGLAASSGARDRVRFVDQQPGHLAHFARADISLTCSRSEAFGRVTIEAMKLGKPVVGAAAGATPELVRDGWNGLLYSPGDADDLAR